MDSFDWQKAVAQKAIDEFKQRLDQVPIEQLGPWLVKQVVAPW